MAAAQNSIAAVRSRRQLCRSAICVGSPHGQEPVLTRADESCGQRGCRQRQRDHAHSGLRVMSQRACRRPCQEFISNAASCHLRVATHVGIRCDDVHANLLPCLLPLHLKLRSRQTVRVKDELCMSLEDVNASGQGPVALGLMFSGRPSAIQTILLFRPSSAQALTCGFQAR